MIMEEPQREQKVRDTDEKGTTNQMKTIEEGKYQQHK